MRMVQNNAKNKIEATQNTRPKDQPYLKSVTTHCGSESHTQQPTRQEAVIDAIKRTG